MASFADVLKKAATQSANAGVKAAQKSSPRAANNTRARDDRGAQAQPTQNWGHAPIVPPAQMMQAPVNQEEESEENSENLGQTFGSIAKKIAESPAGSETQEKFNQENTMTDAELRSKQAPWDQLLSAVGMGPEIAYADTTEEGYAQEPQGKADEEKPSQQSGSLSSSPLISLLSGIDWTKGGLAYQDFDEKDSSELTPLARSQLMNQEIRDLMREARTSGDIDFASYANARNRNMYIPDEVNTPENEEKYNQFFADLYEKYDVPEDNRPDIMSGESGAHLGSQPYRANSSENTQPGTSRSGRGEQNTFLSDYYDYLETPEGKEWAKQYEDLGYADDEVGLANLLASGDIDAVMQLLGASDGWNGSTRLRARYNNSIPDFYDWRSGEFNENARDMLADYLWGDQAISPLGLAEGTDYLSRTLSPEDAALLAQWSNYLADNAEFGMGLKGDPYGFDSRDAALYLYATAMSGDNALDFDEDVTNKMLERAGVTQRVGEVGEGSKAALPTTQTRKYAIPDLLADANAENALNPILDNKNTGYYDRALLASIVAAANADNNGKYGIYDI